MSGSNLIESIEIEVDRDGEIRFYEVDVAISWYHTPERMYERNGDPGTPEDFDFDFQIIHAYEITEDNQAIELGNEYFDELYHHVGEVLNRYDVDTIKG